MPYSTWTRLFEVVCCYIKQINCGIALYVRQNHSTSFWYWSYCQSILWTPFSSTHCPCLVLLVHCYTFKVHTKFIWFMPETAFFWTKWSVHLTQLEPLIALGLIRMFIPKSILWCRNSHLIIWIYQTISTAIMLTQINHRLAKSTCYFNTWICAKRIYTRKQFYTDTKYRTIHIWRHCTIPRIQWEIKAILYRYFDIFKTFSPQNTLLITKRTLL